MSKVPCSFKDQGVYKLDYVSKVNLVSSALVPFLCGMHRMFR